MVDPETCSMCSEMCAIKMVDSYLKTHGKKSSQLQPKEE